MAILIRMDRLFVRLLLGLLMGLVAVTAQAQRIKDIAQVAGVRGNQLVGFGLVTGLNQTGDQTTQTPFTVQALRNMLGQMGINVPPNQFVRLRNVAAVSVNTELPPFAQPGQQVDVNVAAMGNADSLRGGTLLLTPLRGADGQIYAVAQGNVVVTGVGARGAAAQVSINTPTSGRIPRGATVERSVGSPVSGVNSTVLLLLNRNDFMTTQKTADAINQAFGMGTAYPVDGGSIRVVTPSDPAARVRFMARLEDLPVNPDPPPAKVVVSSRNGTVVIGGQVRLRPAAVMQGNVIVTIAEQPQVNQPAPFGGGATAVTPQTQIGVEQQAPRMFVFNPGTSLNELVQAINAVGVPPDDLIAILQALKEAGSLQAELEVI